MKFEKEPKCADGGLKVEDIRGIFNLQGEMSCEDPELKCWRPVPPVSLCLADRGSISRLSTNH